MKFKVIVIVYDLCKQKEFRISLEYFTNSNFRTNRNKDKGDENKCTT